MTSPDDDQNNPPPPDDQASPPPAAEQGGGDQGQSFNFDEGADEAIDPDDAAWLEAIGDGRIPTECVATKGQNGNGSGGNSQCAASPGFSWRSLT